jgi:hypothetical protein
MWIVAIGWIYVVVLMAATETSITAAVMTFLIYCMIPLSILFYLTGSKRRHARRMAAQPAGAKDGHVPSTTDSTPRVKKQGDGASDDDAGSDGGGDGGGGD